MPYPRLPEVRCANPACRTVFRRDRRTRRYCCRQCSADCRPRIVRVLAGRKGGRHSAIARRRESLEFIERATSGMTNTQAFLLGRKYGQSDTGNRVTAARREGYAEGYEAGYQSALRHQETRRSV